MAEKEFLVFLCKHSQQQFDRTFCSYLQDSKLLGHLCRKGISCQMTVVHKFDSLGHLLYTGVGFSLEKESELGRGLKKLTYTIRGWVLAGKRSGNSQGD